MELKSDASLSVILLDNFGQQLPINSLPYVDLLLDTQPADVISTGELSSVGEKKQWTYIIK